MVIIYCEQTIYNYIIKLLFEYFHVYFYILFQKGDNCFNWKLRANLSAREFLFLDM